MTENTIDQSIGSTICGVILTLVAAYAGIRHCSDLIIIDRPQNKKPAWCEPANQEPKKYATYSEWTEYVNKIKGTYCESGTNEQSKEAALRMCIYEEYLTK
jgi:hypothetical protein